MRDRTAPVDSLPLIEKFQLAIREEELDDAQLLLEQLQEKYPEVGSRPIYSTRLMLARGDALGALQNVSGTDSPELEAYCLYVMGDPSWEAIANALVEDSEDPVIRNSMCVLLGREQEKIEEMEEAEDNTPLPTY